MRGQEFNDSINEDATPLQVKKHLSMAKQECEDINDTDKAIACFTEVENAESGVEEIFLGRRDGELQENMPEPDRENAITTEEAESRLSEAKSQHDTDIVNPEEYKEKKLEEFRKNYRT